MCSCVCACISFFNQSSACQTGSETNGNMRKTKEGRVELIRRGCEERKRGGECRASISRQGGTQTAAASLGDQWSKNGGVMGMRRSQSRDHCRLPRLAFKVLQTQQGVEREKWVAQHVVTCGSQTLSTNCNLFRWLCGKHKSGVGWVRWKGEGRRVKVPTRRPR